ncbi:GM17402 [Drosophila sechellia]|uniref:GM17402 n=1 Tax=Drosophila sechellia TaxID=7238 RepID=B4IN26_DROSE|nr:GM17402 [Drosophila sechellia]
MDFVTPANRTYTAAAKPTRGTVYKVRKPRPVKRTTTAPSNPSIAKMLREAAKKENASAAPQRPKKPNATATSSVPNFPNAHNWPACPPLQVGTMPTDETNDSMTIPQIPTVPAAQNRPIQSIGKLHRESEHLEDAESLYGAKSTLEFNAAWGANSRLRSPKPPKEPEPPKEP